MDRLRHLAALAVAATLVVACEEAPKQPAPSRFASVKAEPRPASKLAASFCDKVFPAEGPEARRYVEPPTRPIPGYSAPDRKKSGWRWINLWATWCTPCVAELPLLERWNTVLAKEGKPVAIDLVSLDEESEPLENRVKMPLPGTVSWLRSAEDQQPYLQSLGVESNSAIPIHAFVDPAGNLRCVRVGGVHEGDYPAILSILGG